MKKRRQFIAPLGTIMRISFIQLVLAVIAAAYSYGREASAQELLQRRVSMRVEQKEIKSVLSQLESIANVKFVYSSKSLPVQRKVSISVANKSVSEILDALFSPDKVTYRIVEDRIILSMVKPESILNSSAVGNGGGEVEPEVLEKTVSGKVTDESGKDMPGVTVVLKGSQKGTSTDEKGGYSISVPDEEAGSAKPVLIFSFVGFLSQEVQITAESVVNISLKIDTKSLDEVVVVGYGNLQKKMLSTAVASISSKQIKDLPTTNPGAALAGQMAGVNVQSTNGSPGQPPVIRVRGIGSIQAGNGPLYVVDGYPLENAEAFNMINPQDIESIQVLKDAASAAIYGSRGGNGVIIVTTKRGEKGAAKFAFNTYVGTLQMAKKVDVLNTPQYLQWLKESYINAGKPVPDAVANPAPNLPNTDWQDEIYRNALQQSYQLSVTGGSDAIRYSVSGGYLSQEGIVDLTRYQRYNLRASLDAQISKRIKIGALIAPGFAITDNKSTQGIINGGNPEGGGGIAAGGVVNTGLAMPSLFPVKYANGDYAQPAIDPLYNAGLGSISPNLTNPIASLRLYEDRQESPLFLTSTYLEYQILDGLKFRTNFGFQYGSGSRNVYAPATLGRPGFTTASLSNPSLAAIGAQRIVSLNYNWVSENFFSYDRTFGENHTLSAIAGYSAQKNRITVETLNGQAGTFSSTDVHYVSAAGQILGTTAYGENALVSLYARVNYAFKDKYLFSAAIRRDGSSRFGNNNKYASFPSMSAAWRIKEEGFMDNVDMVSELKIRGSFGLTGNNNIGDYTWQNYLAQNNYVFGAGNGSRVFGYMPGSISNPDLTWETNRQVDAGLELGLFRDRIYITADAYKRNTKDLLFAKNIPALVGFAGNVTENVGEIENKGLELGVTSKNAVGKLKWTTNANISFNKNKVVQLANANFIAIAAGAQANSVRLAPGQALGAFYGYKHVGIYKSQAEIDAMPWAAGGAKPGDIKYADINGDNKIDANDITYLGSPQPKFTWGITNSFEYNNFDLNVIMRGAQGSLIMNANDRLPYYFGPAVNARTTVLNRWKSESEPGDGMEPRVGGVAQNVFSNRFLQEASFLQISNITLGYRVPAKLFNSKITGLRIYAAVQNLYTFTKYDGYNPEANIQNEGGSTQLGIDFGSYPLPRTFLIGVNLNF